MIRSMTGFGEARGEVARGTLRVAVKTVNHRFFNPHLRVPSSFERLEGTIQQWLKRFFFRGHINLTIAFEQDRELSDDLLPELDLERARHYAGLLRSLREELGLEGTPELTSLLRFDDILRIPERAGPEAELDPEVLEALVREAAQGALAMREAEGARLAEDLRDRLSAMEDGLETVQERAPIRLVAERDRLRTAIRELTEQEDVDEDRLAREVAYLSEKWDINEEIVRFGAHLQAFRDTLGEEGNDSVGKRLGFLVQEMHREANTIAAKANDLEMSHASVAIREELERLREQLENVE